MKIRSIQIALISILVGSLLLEGVAVVVARNRMWPQEFRALILKLLAVYSAEIGLVLGGIAGEKGIKEKQAHRGEAMVALGMAAIWTIAIGWRPFMLMFGVNDSIKEVIEYIDEVGFAASFLLAAALAYFFTKKFS